MEAFLSVSAVLMVEVIELPPVTLLCVVSVQLVCRCCV